MAEENAMTVTQTHTPEGTSSPRRGTVPELNDAQRTEALEKARASRVERKQAKADLSAGRRSFEEMLLAGAVDKDPVLKGMRVVELLKAVPGVGQARAAVIMEAVGVAPNRRLAGVGSRQITQLTQQVGQRSTAAAATQQQEVV